MSQNIVIIGAVAAGPKTACRLKRLRPEYHVTMVDRDRTISYGGCGIPYFISGDVSDPLSWFPPASIWSRDEKFFREAKDIEVLARAPKPCPSTATTKMVRVRSLETGEEQELPYDKLVLATGSKPRRPAHTRVWIWTASTRCPISMKRCASRRCVSKGKVGTAVIIGGGAIGLEMAEALADLWGIETTVVEVMDQILPGVVDSTIAHMARKVMEDNEISFLLSERVQSIEGDGAVERVVTDKRTLDADLVIMAVGVQPNADLAKACGLELSKGGGIKVNKRFQTSDPDIYAGGDCVENRTSSPATRSTCRPDRWPTVKGASSGPTWPGAKPNFPAWWAASSSRYSTWPWPSRAEPGPGPEPTGFDAIDAFVVQADRAHFYPEMELLYMSSSWKNRPAGSWGCRESDTRHAGLDGRVNAIGALLKYNATVEDVSNLEVAYAPPFSAAMDIVNALGNTAENILAERNRSMDVDEFDRAVRRAARR